ncbi:MAG: SDR family NAD(P)-dependent oxidoreductase [Ruminococcaceae bacterium]|nr:SDR family NAD(P)-dependent oxidoreductase [Oscillospiraceae bacterium]
MNTPTTNAKRIAVITGASSGMGKRFAETLKEYGSFDEVWVIARRLDRLQELKLDFPTRPLPFDLSDPVSYDRYAALLAKEKPDVALLINASGFGKFLATMDVPLDINLNMIDLNCKAILAMCQHTIPYMRSGAQIINISSVSAFQPVPYINVYGATKAFVLSYSRALNRELRSQGIRVIAVCPFWTKTEFFDRAISDHRDAVVKKYIAMYSPDQIVRRAWRDARRGRDISQFGFKARTQSLLAKLLPHGFVMDFWMKQQKLK